MSYNNYLDADAAYLAVCDLGGEPACVIVKHTNPCGAAKANMEGGQDLCHAYRQAVRADPISAFGGIVAFNRQAAPTLLASCPVLEWVVFAGSAVPTIRFWYT